MKIITRTIKTEIKLIELDTEEVLALYQLIGHMNRDQMGEFVEKTEFPVLENLWNQLYDFLETQK